MKGRLTTGQNQQQVFRMEPAGMARRKQGADAGKVRHYEGMHRKVISAAKACLPIS